MGHSSLGEVAASTASIRPDAAIVIVGESSEHALDLIGRIVTEAACPVIAILDVETRRSSATQPSEGSSDEQRAFEMLRDEARRSNRKIIEIAEAVTVSANLLPRLPVE